MGSVEAVAEELADGGERVVALKRILRTSTADAPRLEMFLREARLTTLIDHPNVIRSLAYGESGGEVFLAMEYVAGEPLSRILATAAERGEPLPPSTIAYVLAEACEGLHAAHELAGPDGAPLGVVHRDVSPHNVMVGYDGSVKLLDFGVAKIDLVDCAARTKTGEVKGKTAYMSPEQAMGDCVDRRSDLYSIGAVLFECVTGRRLWGTGTDFEVLRRLALEDPPRLADVAPATPAPLAELQARLVERDVTKRATSAAEVARTLRALACTDDGPVTADSLRATMEELFPGERERREAAMAQALVARLPPGETPPLLARGGAQGHESTPVFVTHRSQTPRPRPTTERGRSIPLAVAVVVLATSTTVLAIRSVPSGREATDRQLRAFTQGSTPEARGRSAEAAPRGEPQGSTAAAPDEHVRPESATAAAVTTTTLSGPIAGPSPSGPREPARLGPVASPAAPPVVRMNTALRARPSVGTPASAAPPVPSAAPAPPPPGPAPATKGPTEPPDVDPTPF
jgi:serine/threonine-protein kinase